MLAYALGAVALVLVLRAMLGRDERVSLSESVLDSPNPPSVDAYIRAGRKIDAIKLLRQETGLGLKEAKHEVDKRMRELLPV